MDTGLCAVDADAAVHVEAIFAVRGVKILDGNRHLGIHAALIVLFIDSVRTEKIGVFHCQGHDRKGLEFFGHVDRGGIMHHDLAHVRLMLDVPGDEVGMRVQRARNIAVPDRKGTDDRGFINPYGFVIQSAGQGRGR